MTELEFKTLLKMNKNFVKHNVSLPNNGERDIFDLESTVSSDRFYLDVDRSGRIELSKFKLQTRYATTKLPLVRIDIDSPPHLNPDGTKTSRNHIHIYRESDNDTGNLPWAYDLETFKDIEINHSNVHFMDVFMGFCEYCNINMDNVQGVI